MDPSLIEIIKQAVLSARGQGLTGSEERAAAEAVLMSMIPSLSPSIANLIVEQLYPFVAEMSAAA
ncbi:hypothetical protein A6A04_15260 [Paramagnetospirillum marisnigri]|uniref:Uncharacterized protein n=1 Tax=Paramagnetospirillum marisnigri TaxID=1285242 RepID=A0A178MTI4_9PROT|nr:hypothetical protein [Paramagnetospirillum marisnigri]OAN52858.1 hypothetical protein A6A04_15260 [Paramagnetospirillum marisnigri]